MQKGMRVARKLPFLSGDSLETTIHGMYYIYMNCAPLGPTEMPMEWCIGQPVGCNVGKVTAGFHKRSVASDVISVYIFVLFVNLCAHLLCRFVGVLEILNGQWPKR